MPDSPEPVAPLEILFQDESLVVIHKPAGHIVHPAEQPQVGDLVAMKILRDQIGRPLGYCSLASIVKSPRRFTETSQAVGWKKFTGQSSKAVPS